MTAAIETDRLSRRFGTRLAVDAVSLHVPLRSVYGFLGRNGAGKTTTIRMLLGLMRPDSGRARICGIDVARDRLAAARLVGALLEAQGFYPNLTGRENLDLTRRLRGLPATEVDRVIEVVGMCAHGRRRVGGYSLGMRQRLGLASALLGAPPVLILDEPTNGLDPEGIADMREFLRSLPERADATVLLSSHLLGEIEQTATHVGILGEGRLLLQGPLAELRGGLDTEVVVGTDRPDAALEVARRHGFAASAEDGGVVARFAQGAASRTATAELNRVLCAAGIRVHALATRERTLESLYRNASQPGTASSTDSLAIAA